MPGLADKELQIHYGQADNTLFELCHLRCMFQGMVNQQKKHVLGMSSQWMAIKTKAIFDRFQGQIFHTADRY